VVETRQVRGGTELERLVEEASDEGAHGVLVTLYRRSE
jgi:hypothetical protein